MRYIIFIFFIHFLFACKTSKINNEELHLTNAIWKLEKIVFEGRVQNFSTDSIFIYLSLRKSKRDRNVSYKTGYYFIFSTERDSTSAYYFKYPMRGFYDINLAEEDYYAAGDNPSSLINATYIRLAVTRQEYTFNPDLKNNKILKTIFEIAIRGGRASENKVKHFIDDNRLTLINAKSDSIVFLGSKKRR
ncbi:hypothetical protein DC498_25620 [Terrimonas sp.]|uniref:hypothetical protein n=1 Tax=Terrimonas sp. TaxID=1914338 RepID=UPI000D523E41|nr:hypothetical protein [Terrimonas sp.]PVD49330.1 hypothetical protein DC498_25620 [Terrimonas sp.]